jgi:hypothetical protein
MSNSNDIPTDECELSVDDFERIAADVFLQYDSEESKAGSY